MLPIYDSPADEQQIDYMLSDMLAPGRLDFEKLHKDLRMMLDREWLLGGPPSLADQLSLSTRSSERA